MKSLDELDNKEQIRNIRERILSTINETGMVVQNILLFGSRAREDFEKGSDFDLLIVINRDLTGEERKELWYKVYGTLHSDFPYLSFDIIIKSAQKFEQEKLIANTISNEAYLEGVEV